MLSERFEAASKEFADRQAFFGAAGEVITFRNFFFTVAAFAEKCDDHGIEPGDHVTVEVHDAIASTALRLALLRLGATIVPPPGSAGVTYRIDCRLVDHGQSMLASVPTLRVDNSWIKSPSRIVPIIAGGTLVKASSGTTGLPKLRRATEGSLLARVENGRSLRQIELSPVLVAHHAASSPGFSNILRVLFSGGSVMLMKKTPEETMEAVARHGAKLALIPAAKLPVLIAAARTIGPRVYSLRRIQCGGGSISPSLAGDAEQIFGAEVTNSYGSNETGSISHFRPVLMQDDPGIVGQVYPHLSLKFLDAGGVEQDPLRGGQIRVKVPAELQDRSFPDDGPTHDPGGWVSTGDIGRLLPGGLLKLEGRVHDLINLGGNKIAPTTLEASLADATGIRDLVVFRVETDNRIDEVGVAVSGEHGVDAAGIRALLARNFSIHSPVHVYQIDQVPLTTAGKIDRRGLTARYSHGPAQTSLAG